MTDLAAIVAEMRECSQLDCLPANIRYSFQDFADRIESALKAQERGSIARAAGQELYEAAEYVLDELDVDRIVSVASHDRLRDARAAYASFALNDEQAQEREGWRPIETYPDDSFPRLFLCRGRVVQGFKDATGAWTVQHELGWRQMRRAPSHWQPLLPAAPTGGSET